ncbi:MAG: hypothetical protein HC906_17830 [Bacteroidales bacterium]|nr:hypothetical protein [Bacteroidales bacterium]
MENRDREREELENYINILKSKYPQVDEIEIEDVFQKAYMVNFTNYDGVSVTSEKDYLIFDFHATYLDGRVYETTYKDSAAKWDFYQRYNYDHYIFAPKKLPLAGRAEGLIEAFKKMRENDSVLIVLPSELFLKDYEHTTIIYTLKLHKIIPEKEIKTYDSIQFCAFQK